MKKLYIVLAASLLFISCEWFEVDVVEYLDYYTNTAGIESYALDGNYPTGSDGLTNISGTDGDRVITFALRNPQQYTLSPTVIWKGDTIGASGNAPVLDVDYSIAQTNPETIELRLKESFVQYLDSHPNYETIDITITIQDVSSGRIFDPYNFSACINSLPQQVLSAELSKNESISKWDLAFVLPDLSQAKNRDITTLRINGANIPIEIDEDGSVTIKSFAAGLSAYNGKTTFLLGEVLLFGTDKNISEEPEYTIELIDTKGLISQSVTVTDKGLTGVTEFYVSTSGSDKASGSLAFPLATISNALERIFSAGGDESYVIHINGEFSDIEGSDKALIEIVTEEEISVTLQGYATGATIDATEKNKRVLYISGSGANVTLGENITLTGGILSAQNESGAGVLVTNGAKLTLSGSVIENNKAENGIGGGIAVDSKAKLTITSGEIRNNSAIMGAGISVGDASLVMEGGVIKENNAKTTLSFSTNGGGITAMNKADIQISSGIITQNTAGTGGAIYIDDTSTLRLRGSVTINGNTDDAGTTFSNIAGFDGDSIIITGTLAGSTIGITPIYGALPNSIVAKTENYSLTETDSKVFISDNDEVAFSLKDGNLVITPSTSLYVSSTLGSVDSNAGTQNEPFGSVQKAVEIILATIESGTDESVFIINVRGEITQEGTLDVGTDTDGNGDKDDGFIEIESDKKVSIVIQGWDDSTTQAIETGTLKADGTERVLSISGSTVDVTLGSGITLTGGSLSAQSERGAGVLVSGGAKLTLLAGASIENNTAQYGGGVYIEDGSFTMSGGEIRDNTATVNAGGVYINSGTFSMSGGTIGGDSASDANKANIDGGGIFINHGASVLLDGGTISGNKASLEPGCSGGAIFVEDGATLTMKSGNITGNEADNGGAIAINGDGKHSNDETTQERALFTMFGGTISGNTVFHENGYSKGGAIYVNGSSASFTMNNGTIKNNEAKESSKSAYAGGVYVEKGTFTMEDGTISKNTSGTYAGGVYIADGFFNMNDGKIHSNSATGNAGGVLVGHPSEGNAEFNMSGGSIQHNNTNDTNGGGVYVENRGILNLSGSPTIKDNGSGGSFTENNDVWELTGETPNNVWFANSNLDNSNIVIVGELTGSEKVGLSPHVYAVGPVLVKNKEAHTFNENYFFIDDTSTDFILYQDGYDVRLRKNELFISNDGGGNGLTANTPMTVNTQASFEAAMDLLVGGSGTMWVMNTLQVGSNTTWVTGQDNDITLKRYSGFEDALINVTGGEFIVQNITLDGENISVDDVLIRVNAGATLTLNYGTTLQNNKNEGPEGLGGALYSEGTVTLKGGSSIKDNIADQYGKLQVESPGKGGGIYANGGTINMYEGATIASNNAKGQEAKGGGVALYNNAQFNFYGGTISDNENTNDETSEGGNDQKGAGVYIESGTLTMSSAASVITGNKSDEGGGVYALAGAAITMNNGSIKNNSANLGAGVYVIGEDSDGKKTSFEMKGGIIGGISKDDANTGVHGGGVYVNGANFTMSNTATISNNKTTTGSGGGVYMIGSEDNLAKVTLKGGSITDNTASVSGGGILMSGDYVSLELTGNPTIIKNESGSSVSRTTNIIFDNAADGTSPIKITAALTGTVNSIGLWPPDDEVGSVIAQWTGTGGMPLGTASKFIMDYDTDFELQERENNIVLGYPKIETVYLKGDGDDTKSGKDNTNAVATFAAALALLKDTQDAVIIISSTINVDTANTLWDGKPEGRVHSVKIQRLDGFTSNLIRVIHDGNLTLKNITIDGMGGVTADFDNNKNTPDTKGAGSVTATRALINVSGGKLTLETGAVLQNNNSANLFACGGVFVDTYSTLIMNGGTIVGNTTAQNGGGVYVEGGTFTMFGGVISDNTASSGGGVYVKHDTGTDMNTGNDFSMPGTFNMSGGTIMGNTANTNGGGVYVGEHTYNGKSYVNFNIEGDPVIKDNMKGADENNVYLINSEEKSPVKIVGELTGTESSIGLSPVSINNGDVVVENKSSDSDVEKLFHDEGNATFYNEGTDIKVKTTFNIGDIGPGGGVVFDITDGAHKEVSSELGTCTWHEVSALIESYDGGGCDDWTFPKRADLQAVYDALIKDKDPVLLDENESFWIDEDPNDNWYYLFNFTSGSGNRVSYYENDERYIAIRSFTP